MRVVCYKSLKDEFADDPAEQRRFVREARVSAMLQHPNTVPTYELGRDRRGHYYFTMKFIHGYTLREILDYRERYDLTRLVEVIIQAAHGLGYAHSHGVAHRGHQAGKRAGGAVRRGAAARLGLAKGSVWRPEGVAGHDAKSASSSVEQEDLSLTDQGDLQGTVSYMSPEQIREDPAIDHRTDLYSLGSVLYEVLAGQPPVAGDTVDEILNKTLAADLQKPSVHREIPSRLEEICMRCLRHEPSERPQTAEELIRELQERW